MTNTPPTLDLDHIPTLTYGLDLGDVTTHFTVLDHAGKVVDQGVIGTSRQAFAMWFHERGKGRVVLEASTHFRWASQLVADLGFEVLVANPRRLKLIYGDHDKTDRKDSMKLARLGRYEPRLLHPIHRRSDASHAGLMRLKARDILVRQRTSLIAFVRSSIKAFGERIPSGTRSERFVEVARGALTEETLALVAPVVDQIASLTESIKAQDRQLEELCREVYPETEILREVKGVGPVTALAYVLTIDDPGRFEQSRDVGAYLGLVPKRDQSGQCDKQLSITKTGDAFMRRLLLQAANYILRKPSPDTDLKRWGLGIAERGGRRGRQRAKVAVARKLAVLLHRLWTTGEVYQPVGYHRGTAVPAST